MPIRYVDAIFYFMSLRNSARYMYGFIIGMCFEYIIRVELLIYPIVIILCMLTIMVVDLVSEHRTNTQYNKYYKARNKRLSDYENFLKSEKEG